jgi:hypothetical protein
MKDMPRRKVTAVELREILARELRCTAGDSCLRCHVPMPVSFGSRPGAWRIAGIDECSTLCHTILADIAAKLAADYELKEPPRSAG